MRYTATITALIATVALAACTTPQEGETTAEGTTATGTAEGEATTNTTAGTSGGTTGGTAGGTAGTGGGASLPGLVNVNLENVLNDLSVRLNIDRANIPVNAQVPISVAANVCGVSVNVLSVSTGGQASCTAKTSSAELAQTVQQQMAAGGNVGGGDQTTGGTTNNMM